MATEIESESTYPAECEVCGWDPCECPRPLGDCVGCGKLLSVWDDGFHTWANYRTDSEGDHYCMKCWPGGEA